MTVFFGLVCAGIAFFIFVSLIINTLRSRNVKINKKISKSALQENNLNNIELSSMEVEHTLSNQRFKEDNVFVDLNEQNDILQDDVDETSYKTVDNNFKSEDSTFENGIKENKILSDDLIQDNNIFQNDLRNAIESENVKDDRTSRSIAKEGIVNFKAEDNSDIVMEQDAFQKTNQYHLEHVEFGEHIVTLFVLARNEQKFEGYELYQTIIDEGLVFGNMDIFHYFINKDPRARHAFSIAKATEPGTFDLDSFGSKSYSGICLLMNLDLSAESEENFELMLEKAYHIARSLNGVVCDDNKRPLSNADLELYYEKNFSQAFTN